MANSVTFISIIADKQFKDWQNKLMKMLFTSMS